VCGLKEAYQMRTMKTCPRGLMAALSPGCLTLVLEQLERYRDDVGDGLPEGEDATQRELARIKGCGRDKPMPASRRWARIEV